MASDDKDDKKPKVKADSEPAPADGPTVTADKAGSADVGPKLFINFFDDMSLAPLELAEGTELEIRAVGRKDDLCTTVPLCAKDDKGRQFVKLDGFFNKIQAFAQAKKTEQKTPGIAETKQQEIVLAAALRLISQPELSECSRYGTGQVNFQAHVPPQLDDKPATESCCNCLPFPLSKLPETCIIRFRAYDASGVDFVENARTFQNEVQWTVNAVRTTPATAANAGSTASASVTNPAPAAQTFTPFSATLQSVNGVADFYNIPPNQLYQFEAVAPDGYLTEECALQLQYICCDRFMEIPTYFRPCGVRPVHTLAFVLDKCQTCRWEGIVTIAGKQLTVPKSGIVPVPDDLEGGGSFAITAPGVSFNPPTLELGPGTSPVTTFTVADQPISAMGQPVQATFVDQSNKPFVRRPVWVLLPNGDEIQVTTDDNGNFVAPAGSQVYAREDEWGMATEPLLIC